jgi:hypothetical protein
VARLACFPYSASTQPCCHFWHEGAATGCPASDAGTCAKHARVNRIIHHGIRVNMEHLPVRDAAGAGDEHTFSLFRNGGAAATEASSASGAGP